MKQAKMYYVVNAITLYRILAAFLLFFLIYINRPDVFKWMLGISFFTDLIDGPLSRKFKVSSNFGTYIDSIGDDLTVIAGLAGIYFFKRDFLYEQQFYIVLLFSLFIIQIVMALIRYGRISSFHTIMAKTAAILQGTFLILLFLLPEPVYFLFYSAVFVTVIDLLEEMILVVILSEWKTNVKGLYWVLKDKKD